MSEEFNWDIPKGLHAKIKVVGVGGGGGNAVNHMYELGIKDVDFVLCNTDAQAMAHSPVQTRIQLGETLTQGKGAGNRPQIGEQAAIESLPQINAMLEGTEMVFITAGMGGGTGTGAAPVIAKAAREKKILTVAIVTIPFDNEGKRRMAQAIDGIENIRNHVDSLLVVRNERLLHMYGNLPITEAFAKADDVLATAAKGIAEIITVHGYINVDFSDVETVMTNSGVSLMGSGIAKGDDRAKEAVQNAITSPLLDSNDIRGASNILLNITYGKHEVTMDEVGIVIDAVQQAAGSTADLIWGHGVDNSLDDELKVTVIATGFGENVVPELYLRNHKPERININDPLDGSKASTAPGNITVDTRKTKAGTSANGSFASDGQGVITFDVNPNSLGYNTLAGSPAASSSTTVNAETNDAANLLMYDINDMDNVPAYLRSRLRSGNLDSIPACLHRNVESNDINRPAATEFSNISLDDLQQDIVSSPDNSYLSNVVD